MISARHAAPAVKDRPTDIPALHGPRTATKDPQRQSSTPQSDLQIIELRSHITAMPARPRTAWTGRHGAFCR